MTAVQGQRGTYQGRSVEITAVNSDTTLNLKGTDESDANKAPFTASNVPANQFTPEGKAPYRGPGES